MSSTTKHDAYWQIHCWVFLTLAAGGLACSTMLHPRTPAEMSSEARHHLQEALAALDGMPAIRLPTGDLAAAAAALVKAERAARVSNDAEAMGEMRFLQGCVMMLRGEYQDAFDRFEELANDSETRPVWAYLAHLWSPIVMDEQRSLGPNIYPHVWDEIDAIGPSSSPLQKDADYKQRGRSLFKKALSMNPEMSKDLLLYGKVILDYQNEKYFMAALSDLHVTGGEAMWNASGPKLIMESLKSGTDRESSAINRFGITGESVVLQNKALAVDALAKNGNKDQAFEITKAMRKGHSGIERIHANLLEAGWMLAPEHGIHSLNLPFTILNYDLPHDLKIKLIWRQISSREESVAWELLDEALTLSQVVGNDRLKGEVLLQTAMARLVRMQALKNDLQQKQVLSKSISRQLEATENLFHSTGDKLALRRVAFIRAILAAEISRFNDAEIYLRTANAGMRDGMSLGFAAIIRAAGIRALLVDNDPIRGFELLRLAVGSFSQLGALLAVAKTENQVAQVMLGEFNLSARGFRTALRGLKYLDAAFKGSQYDFLPETRKLSHELSILYPLVASIFNTLNDYPWEVHRQAGRDALVRLDNYVTQIELLSVSFTTLRGIVGRGTLARLDNYVKDIETLSLSMAFALLRAMRSSLKLAIAMSLDMQEMRDSGVSTHAHAALVADELPTLEPNMLIWAREGKCDKAEQAAIKTETQGVHRLSALVPGLQRKSKVQLYRGLAEVFMLCKMVHRAKKYTHSMEKLIGDPVEWMRESSLAAAEFSLIGRVELELGNYPTALEWLRRSVEVVERKHQMFFDGVPRPSWDISQDYGATIDALLHTYQETHQVDAIAEAFILADRVKGRAFSASLLASERLTSMRGDSAMARYQELAAWYQAAARLDVLSRRALRTGSDDQTREFEADIRNAERAQRKLEQSIAANPDWPVPRAILGAVREPPPLSIPALAKALPKNAVLLQYFLHGEHLFIWSLDAQGVLEVQPVKLLPDALLEKPIERFQPMAPVHILFDRQIDRLVQAIERGDNDNEFNALIQRLSDLLIKPVSSKIDTRQRIIIIPHASLHRVPFEILMHGRMRLIEKHIVSYVPNAATVMLLSRRKRPSITDAKPLFIYEPGVPGWQTGRSMMQRIYPQLEEIDASKQFDQLQARLHGARAIINIALHGAARDDEPDRVHLQIGESHSLTNVDVLGMDLRKVPLVTLTSCDSARTAISNGDELSGLARSFHYAGVPDVIASLWKIPAGRSYQIMRRFHKNYRQHGDAARALAEAKQSYLADERKSSYVHPFFWAGLIHSGL